MSGSNGRPRDWLEMQEPVDRPWRGRTHEIGHLVPPTWLRDLRHLQLQLNAEPEEWAVKLIQLPILDFQPVIRAAVTEAEKQNRVGPFQVVLLGIPLAYTYRSYPEYGLMRLREDGTEEWRFVSVTGHEHHDSE